jgi:hypothetical protein
MGVWNMLYLMRKYGEAIENANNPAFSHEHQCELILKAEDLRLEMAHYLTRVEER